MVRSPISILLVACLAALGCEGSERLRTFCTGDGDCPAGFRCQIETGLCVCAVDEVCPPGQYCAPDGQCRRRLSCDSNQDCPRGTFCDTTTGNCIELGKCTQDRQCPAGQICSEVFFRCVPGCRQDGDCELYDLCLEGSCQKGLCRDKTFCAIGQLCDEATHTCYDDTRGPYCAYCKSATIYDPDSCGEGPNFCLVKGGDLTLPPYCGVDCDQGQECPNGFDCASVRIVYTSENCTRDDQCASGKCYIREGDQKGFCLCTQDSNCPQDACDLTFLRCSVTRRPCTPGGNECDRPIFCIGGYCHIGRNCKPLEGLRCEDLR